MFVFTRNICESHVIQEDGVLCKLGKENEETSSGDTLRFFVKKKKQIYQVGVV